MTCNASGMEITHFTILTFVYYIYLLFNISLAQEQGLCHDPQCSDPISEGQALNNYNSDSENKLSFKAREVVSIYGKDFGLKKELLFVKINDRIGFVPKNFIKESKVFHNELTPAIIPFFGLSHQSSSHVSGLVNSNQGAFDQNANSLPLSNNHHNERSGGQMYLESRSADASFVSHPSDSHYPNLHNIEHGHNHVIQTTQQVNQHPSAPHIEGSGFLHNNAPPHSVHHQTPYHSDISDASNPMLPTISHFNQYAQATVDFNQQPITPHVSDPSVASSPSFHSQTGYQNFPPPPIQDTFHNNLQSSNSFSPSTDSNLLNAPSQNMYPSQSQNMFPNESPSSLANQNPSSFQNQDPSSFQNQDPSSFQNQNPDSFVNQNPSYFQNQNPSASPNQNPNPFSNEYPQQKLSYGHQHQQERYMNDYDLNFASNEQGFNDPSQSSNTYSSQLANNPMYDVSQSQLLPPDSSEEGYLPDGSYEVDESSKHKQFMDTMDLLKGMGYPGIDEITDQYMNQRDGLSTTNQASFSVGDGTGRSYSDYDSQKKDTYLSSESGHHSDIAEPVPSNLEKTMSLNSLLNTKTRDIPSINDGKEFGTTGSGGKTFSQQEQSAVISDSSFNQQIQQKINFQTQQSQAKPFESSALNNQAGNTHVNKLPDKNILGSVESSSSSIFNKHETLSKEKSFEDSSENKMPTSISKKENTFQGSSTVSNQLNSHFNLPMQDKEVNSAENTNSYLENAKESTLNKTFPDEPNSFSQNDLNGLSNELITDNLNDEPKNQNDISKEKIEINSDNKNDTQLGNSHDEILGSLSNDDGTPEKESEEHIGNEDPVKNSSQLVTGNALHEAFSEKDISDSATIFNGLNSENIDYANQYQSRHLNEDTTVDSLMNQDIEDNITDGSFDLYANFGNSLQAVRSFIDIILLWVPEPLYSTIIELEEKGIPHRVPVFTILSAIPCVVVVIITIYIKEKSKESKLTAQLTAVEAKLYHLTSEKNVLENKLEKAEAQITSYLSTLDDERNGYKNLKMDIDDLRENLEKANIEIKGNLEDIKVLKDREKEYVELIADHEKTYLDLLDKKNDTEKQLTDQEDSVFELTNELQEKDNRISRLEKENTEYIHLNEDYNNKITQQQQNCSQLLQEAEVWNLKVNELTSKLNQEVSSKEDLENSVQLKDDEIESLNNLVKTFKEFENIDESDENNFESNEEKLQSLINSSKTLVQLEKQKEENIILTDKLSEEKNKLLDFEVELLDSKSEVDKLKLSYNQALQDKAEAQTKLDVLTNYFKDKEILLQKQLGVQEAVRQKTEEDASSAERRICLIEQENTSYKSQVASMKQEVEETERNLKSQIAVQEKKAHENWIAARAAERKLEDMKQEVTQLRQRLTLLERQQETRTNSMQDDVLRPIPKRLNDDSTISQNANHSMDSRHPMFPLPPPMLLPSDRPLPIFPPPPPPPFLPPHPMELPHFRPQPWHLPPHDSEFRMTPPEFARARASTPPRNRGLDGDAGPRQSSPLGSDMRDSRNSTPSQSLPDFHDIPPRPMGYPPFNGPPRFPMPPPFRHPPGHNRSDFSGDNMHRRGQHSPGPHDSWQQSNSRV